MHINELPFLNVIRGSSALLVLFFHFFVFFFTAQDMSAGLINAAPLELTDPSYLAYVEAIPFNIGHLGVAFFFLLTGFFIQHSLEKYNQVGTFLGHKFLRLWPTYAVSFAIGLVFVFFFSQLRNDLFPYSFDHLLSYFTLTRDIFHYDYIDGSVWSLEVQIKYYIFAALIWYFFRHRFLEAMTAALVILMLIGFGLRESGWFDESEYRYLVYTLNKDVKYSLLITMGACYYSYYSKKVSLLTFGIVGLILLGCFGSPLSQFSRPPLMYSYYLGVVLFGCSIFFKNVGQQSRGFGGRTMEWFAKISYPLYVCQVIPGYTILYYMLEQGYSFYTAVSIAMAVIFPIAYLIHKYVETGTARMKVRTIG